MEGNNPRKILENLRNETECCICTEVYTDPRALPCGHTFCLTCLNSHATSNMKYPGQKMNCPICRQEFVIPIGGVSDLQKNFFLERMIDMTEARKKAYADARPLDLCEACLEGSDPESYASLPDSVMFCVECQQKLCKECAIHHKKNKMTKCHNIVAIDSQSSVTLPKTFVPKSCSEHHKECLIFCENCSQVVCPLCFVEKHKLHNGSDVQKYLGEFATKVDDQVNILSVFLEESEKNKEKLEEIAEKFNSKVAAVKLEISERAEKMKQIVDRQMKALLTEVDAFKQEFRNEFLFQRDRLEFHISGIEGCRSYCTDISSEVSVNGVDKTLSNISETVEQLREKHQNQMEQEFSNPVLLFEAEDLGSYFTGQCNILGKVEASMSMQTITGRIGENKTLGNILDVAVEATNVHGLQCYQNEGKIGFPPTSPVFERSIRTRLSKKKVLICGITVLDDILYVVHENSTSIACYDVPSLEFEGEIQVEGLTDPRDIASDKDAGFLYILNQSDYDDGSLCHVLKMAASGDVVLKWYIGRGSDNLSVCESGDILISCCGRSALKRYSSDGQLVSELTVCLDSSLFFNHAVEIEKGKVLVCYGSDTESGLNLVDLNSGAVLVRYSNDGCIATGASPIYLAVDDRRNVFVVDRRSKRLLMFSNNMKAVTEVRSRGNLIRCPYKVHLDCENGLLFLIDGFFNRRKKVLRDSRVLVFSFDCK